jgi:hypothetical protein
MPNDDTGHPIVGEGFAGLKPWNLFCDAHFPKPNGKPRSKRSRQDIAKRYGFTLVRIGNQNFVDEEFEGERLRRALRGGEREPPRRPGRPKKGAANGAASSR